MPLFVLLGGFALFAWYLYGQTAEADVSNTNADAASGAATLQYLASDGNVYTLPNTVGFRNRNPGNLRYIANNPWNGPVGQASGYGVYDSLENGIRAMGKQLSKEYANGANTVAALIAPYAPPSENPTQGYTAYVAKAIGVDPSAQIALPDYLLPVVQAMIHFENGSNPLPDQFVLDSLNS